eukprot:3754416-Rhodomonas_salina.1
MSDLGGEAEGNGHGGATRAGKCTHDVRTAHRVADAKVGRYPMIAWRPSSIQSKTVSIITCIPCQNRTPNSDCNRGDATPFVWNESRMSNASLNCSQNQRQNCSHTWQCCLHQWYSRIHKWMLTPGGRRVLASRTSEVSRLLMWLIAIRAAAAIRV